MSNNIMALINDEISAHVLDDAIILLENYGASLIEPPTTVKDILNYLLENDSAEGLDVLEHTNYDLNALGNSGLNPLGNYDLNAFGNNLEDNVNVSDMVARSQQSQQIQSIGPMLQIGDYKPVMTDQASTLTTEEDNFFVDPDDGTIVYLPTDLGETVAQTQQTYSREENENQKDYAAGLDFLEHTNYDLNALGNSDLNPLGNYDLNALGNNLEDNVNVSDMVARSQQSQQIQSIGPMLQIGDYKPAMTDQTSTLTTEEDNFFVDPDDGTIVYLPTDLGETVAQTQQTCSREEKENRKDYECMICRRTFRRHHNFRLHMKIHDPKSYECKVCHHVFDSRHYWDLHMKSHTSPKTHNCKECNRPFPNKLQLSVHMTSHHSNAELYKCNVCNKKFEFKYCLEEHKKVHLDLPYKCTVCIKSFQHQNLLDRHLKTHSGKERLWSPKDPPKQTLVSSYLETP